MIKIYTTFVAVLSSLFALTALADAQCETSLDGNTWNLACSADGGGDNEDDYQCDYVVSLSYSQGDADQQEATGFRSARPERRHHLVRRRQWKRRQQHRVRIRCQRNLQSVSSPFDKNSSQ